MSLLETNFAPEIIRMLEKARDNGAQYMLLEKRNPDMQLRPYDLNTFKTLDEVLEYLDEKENHEYVLGGEEYPSYYQKLDKFLEEIKQANSLEAKLLMTRDEFKDILSVAGYNVAAVNDGLTYFDRGTYPKFSINHQEHIGYDIFTVMPNFETNGMDIRFVDGHAGLLRVPIAHNIIGGIDTAKLEDQIAAVHWSWDHPFIAGELPDDTNVVYEAGVLVPGIYSDLDKLYHHSPEGQLLAEQLCCRHIIWRIGEDQNSPLPNLLEQKYYVSEELTGIVKPTAAYELLAAKPVPELDISQHIGDFIQRQLKYNLPIKQTPIIMNLNNLQDLKREVNDLGFSAKVADELEKNIKAEPVHFTVKDQLPGDKGQVDFNLHFHKSNVSDTYSFSKYDATAGKVPPTVEHQSYMVLSENKDDKEKPLVKQFESPNEAIDFFKKQKGTSELAIGESPESRELLASKENGKVNYVNDNFRAAYFSPSIKQTFYVKEGVGFTATQAANMVQGRTVHRQDLINPNRGEAYNAWIKLDFEQKKDGYDNFKLKQMNDPAFGFDLEKTLHNFKIKELADPAKKETIMAAMKNGDRLPLTITNKENKEVSVMVEAVPQYKTLDFYNENGTKQKRELFKKPDVAEQSQGKNQGKSKDKEEEHSLSIR
jgi:hypothetical protein